MRAEAELTGGLAVAAVELERYRVRSLFLPINEQVAGVATA